MCHLARHPVRVHPRQLQPPGAAGRTLARRRAALLRRYLELPGHTFWSDDVGLGAAPEVDLAAAQGYRQVTDAHLLVLAARRGGRLVTFDRAAAALGIAEVTLLSMA